MTFGGDDFFGLPISLGQFGYMAEAEGQEDLINTEESRFNAALAEVREEYGHITEDINVTSEVNEILRAHGISPENLSASQVRRIQATLD